MYFYIDGVVKIDGGEPAPESSPCDLQLKNVWEGRNTTLSISLTRSLNIHDNAWILCRTQQQSATANLDFVGLNSIVRFSAYQTKYTVNVTLINDKIYESSEQFFVVLEAVENGKALPDRFSSKLCILIGADIEDGEDILNLICKATNCAN